MSTKTKYTVLRPPLTPSFEVPSREALLKLKKGDSVKVRFLVDSEHPERMWVKLNSTNDPEDWTGRIDNESEQKLTSVVLKPDTLVHFHPYDIIAIYDL
jgi:hypothetical protein